VLRMLILHGSFLPETNGQPSRFVVWGESPGQSSPPAPHGRPSKSGAPRSAVRAPDCPSPAGRRSRHSDVRTPRSALRARLHPFAATLDNLIYETGGWMPDVNAQDLWVVAYLPTVSGRPSPSRQPMVDSEPFHSQPHLEPWRVPAIGIASAEVLGMLVRMPPPDERGGVTSIGSD